MCKDERENNISSVWMEWPSFMYGRERRRWQDVDRRIKRREKDRKETERQEWNRKIGNETVRKDRKIGM